MDIVANFWIKQLYGDYRDSTAVWGSTIFINQGDMQFTACDASSLFSYENGVLVPLGYLGDFVSAMIINPKIDGYQYEADLYLSVSSIEWHVSEFQYFVISYNSYLDSGITTN